jgi:hypothetical protein
VYISSDLLGIVKVNGDSLGDARTVNESHWEKIINLKDSLYNIRRSLAKLGKVTLIGAKALKRHEKALTL